MAAITDNALFLYKCLTESKYKIDWNVVGNALNLKSGTASMRWQRLKARLEKSGFTGTNVPSSTVIDETTLFLYQCVIASGCKIDFNAVGKVTGLKASTASMRYYRLQQKIQQSHGYLAAPAANGTGATRATIAPNKPRPKPKPKFAKRKASAVDDEDSGADSKGEVRKKVKTEGTDPLTQRQTRGKILNLKEMLGDSSSAGTSTTGTNVSSTCQASLSNTSADDDVVDDDGSETPMTRSPVKATAVTYPTVVKNIQKAGREVIPLAEAAVTQEPKDNAFSTGRSVSPQISEQVSNTRGSASPDHYATPRSIRNSQQEQSHPVKQSLVPRIDEVKAKKILPLVSSSPSPEIKPEAAAVDAPMSARLRERYVSHGSTLLQEDIDRDASITTDDSISMIGLTAKADPKPADPREPIENSEKILLG